MKFFLPVVATVFFTASTANAECPNLKNTDAPFWTAFKTSSNLESLNAIASKLNINENLSQCLASSQINSIDLLNLAMDKKCKRTIDEVFPNLSATKDLTLSPIYKEIFDNFANFQSVDPSKFMTVLETWRVWVYSLDVGKTNKVCANVRDNAIHCIEGAVFDLVFENLLDNECCAGFKEDFKTRYTGRELNRETLSRRIRDILNIPCAIQTPGFGSVNQTCMHTFIQATLDENYPLHLKAAMSVKEQSACDSYLGKTFQVYSSPETHKYPHPTGCCASQVDALLFHINSLPFVKSGPAASLLTQPGKCVNVLELEYVQKVLQLAPASLKQKAHLFLDGLCLHFNPGAAHKCDFNELGSTCDIL